MKWTASLFLAAAFLWPAAGFSQEKISLLETKGMLHFNQGEYQKALKFFDKIYLIHPKNETNLHRLGAAYLQMRNYRKAAGFLEKLLKQNPGYQEAYFDYGLSLFEQGEFQKALAWFEKESKQKKNPYPIYFAGLSHYYLGRTSEALALLREVQQHFPGSDLAAAAQRRLGRIEEEAAHPEKPAKIKRWDLWGSLSNYYDSNVTRDPDNQNLAGFGDRDDFLSAATLDFNYLLLNMQKTRLQAQYGGYQSLHWNAINIDANRFNYGSHKAGVEMTRKISDQTQWTLPFNYNFVYLGKAKYLQSITMENTLDMIHMDHWMFSVTGGVRQDWFFQSLLSTAQNRDATQPYARLEQYFFAPHNREVYFKAGYGYEKNFAKGNDWDFDAHHVLYAMHFPIGWKVEFLMAGDAVVRRNFDKTDSVFSAVRQDKSLYHTAVFARDILPLLRVALSYSFFIQDSSLARFTYRRHVGGLTFSTKL